MLSKPIGPCIRKNRWTAGILSMLQLVRIDVEQPQLSVGSWRHDLVLETQTSDGRTRKAGGEWQSQHLSEHSDLSCLIADEAFEKTPASLLDSLAWLFCKIIPQRFLRFLVLNSATSNLPVTLSPFVTSSCPDLGPLQYHSFRMFHVIQKVLTNASDCKVGFTCVQNLTSKNSPTAYLSWSVCCLQVESLTQHTL